MSSSATPAGTWGQSCRQRVAEVSEARVSPRVRRDFALDVWVNDFRFGADFVGAEGLIVNHTDEVQSHDGVDYDLELGEWALGQQVAFQMPDPRGDELGTIIDHRLSAGMIVAWVRNYTDSYVNWSLGDDTFYGPSLDERLEVLVRRVGLHGVLVQPVGL